MVEDNRRELAKVGVYLTCTIAINVITTPLVKQFVVVFGMVSLVYFEMMMID